MTFDNSSSLCYDCAFLCETKAIEITVVVKRCKKFLKSTKTRIGKQTIHFMIFIFLRYSIE